MSKMNDDRRMLSPGSPTVNRYQTKTHILAPQQSLEQWHNCLPCPASTFHYRYSRIVSAQSGGRRQTRHLLLDRSGPSLHEGTPVQGHTSPMQIQPQFSSLLLKQPLLAVTPSGAACAAGSSVRRSSSTVL
jgi:hypothetical protein